MLQISQEGHPHIPPQPHHLHSLIASNHPPNIDTQLEDDENLFLKLEIDQRFHQSHTNQQYLFPRRHLTSQQSNTSLAAVSKYDLNDQNPGFFSFKRCMNPSRKVTEQEYGSRLTRKILEVSRVRDLSKESGSRNKKRRKVQVKQIHLTSKVDEEKRDDSVARTPHKTIKKLLSGVNHETSKQTEDRDRSQSPKMIKIIHKPEDDNTMVHVPTSNTLLQQAQGFYCPSPKCKCPLRSQDQQLVRRPLARRAGPDIRHLVVEKREIKILTSKEFNERRGRENGVLEAWEVLTEKKNLSETRKFNAFKGMVAFKA